MIIFFATVFGFYFFLLIILLIGWTKAIQNKREENIVKQNFISVVIAIRNESPNINQLLTCFVNQSYSQNNFEIIIVDDHSEDDSTAKVSDWKNRLSNLRLISLDEGKSGKKTALSAGISASKGEIIATTDADCFLPIRWLERINQKFQNDHTGFAIGLVVITPGESLFSRIESIEFASVIATGVATLGLKRPTMCNGANLSFRKRMFEAVDGYSGNEHISSGDDEFLMRKVNKRFPEAIQLLNWDDSIVETKPQANVHDFVQQRLRWASKWKVNHSWHSKALAVFIFLVQLFWVAMLPILFWYSELASIFIIKVLIDIIFIFPICKFLKIEFRWLPFIALQFVYPFYVLYIGFFSQTKTHQWKGRKF